MCRFSRFYHAKVRVHGATSKAEKLWCSMYVEKKLRRAQVSIVVGLGLTFYTIVLLAKEYCYLCLCRKKFSFTYVGR